MWASRCRWSGVASALATGPGRLLHVGAWRCGRGPSVEQKRGVRSTVYYVAAAAVLTIGLSYAAVPLYRIFCQAYSYGGTTSVGHDSDKVESMVKRKDRLITVRFNADRSASMRWNFKPLQTEIKVVPGETALAFYTAENPTDQAVIGISTYNVIPFEAGQYFNKIQCFCFEEQMLNPAEQVSGGIPALKLHYEAPHCIIGVSGHAGFLLHRPGVC